MKKIILPILAAMFVAVSCSGQTNKDKDGKGGTIHLTTADFQKKVFDLEAGGNELKYLGDKPAIIDFYADWCPPCKTIAPILEELAEEYKGRIYVYKVNVDKENALSAAFNIQSIPTLIFIPMKGKPQVSTGAMPKKEFVKNIENVLGVKPAGEKK